MIFTAKSKTFLLGEYVVRSGGSSIVLATNPEFQLVCEKSDGASFAGLKNCDVASPAREFYDLHAKTFEGLCISFIDPYKKSGGLGASSAQFTLLYKLFLQLTGGSFNTSQFLHEYKSLKCNLKSNPSGADCVCQFNNQHTYFDSAAQIYENILWCFFDIDFAVFKSNVKISTSKHLEECGEILNDDLFSLNQCVKSAYCSFIANDSQMLADSVNKFYHILESNNLVIKSTKQIVSCMKNIGAVLAVKGCGALLADTIVVIFRKNCFEAIAKQAVKMELTYVASSSVVALTT